jgi:hypothetical protein
MGTGCTRNTHISCTARRGSSQEPCRGHSRNAAHPSRRCAHAAHSVWGGKGRHRDIPAARCAGSPRHGREGGGCGASMSGAHSTKTPRTKAKQTSGPTGTALTQYYKHMVCCIPRCRATTRATGRPPHNPPTRLGGWKSSDHGVGRFTWLEPSPSTPSTPPLPCHLKGRKLAGLPRRKLLSFSI